MHEKKQIQAKMVNGKCVEDKVSHGRYGSKTPYLTIKKQLHLNEMKLPITSKTKSCFTMNLMSKALVVSYAQAVQNLKHFDQPNYLQVKHWQEMQNLFSNFKQFIAIHVVAHNLEMQISTVLSFFPPIFMFDLFTSVQKFFCWWKNWS